MSNVQMHLVYVFIVMSATASGFESNLYDWIYLTVMLSVSSFMVRKFRKPKSTFYLFIHLLSCRNSASFG